MMRTQAQTFILLSSKLSGDANTYHCVACHFIHAWIRLLTHRHQKIISWLIWESSSCKLSPVPWGFLYINQSKTSNLEVCFKLQCSSHFSSTYLLYFFITSNRKKRPDTLLKLITFLIKEWHNRIMWITALQFVSSMYTTFEWDGNKIQTFPNLYILVSLDEVPQMLHSQNIRWTDRRKAGWTDKQTWCFYLWLSWHKGIKTPNT